MAAVETQDMIVDDPGHQAAIYGFRSK